LPGLQNSARPDDDRLARAAAEQRHPDGFRSADVGRAGYQVPSADPTQTTGLATGRSADVGRASYNIPSANDTEFANIETLEPGQSAVARARQYRGDDADWFSRSERSL